MEATLERWRLLAPLRHRAVALLVAGQAASNIGDGLYAVALPWYVLAHRGGTLMLAGVLAAYGVPRALFIPVGGMLADRIDAWRTMILADLTRATAVGGLAVFAFSGRAELAFLLPIAIVVGTGEGLFMPSSQALVPALVPGEILQPANALVTLGNEMASILGPVAGGVVVAAVGADVGFGVDAGSFLISVASLVAIGAASRQPASGRGEAEPQPVEAAGADADDSAPVEPADPPAPPVSMLSVLRDSSVFRVVLLITVMANLCVGGVLSVALPVLVRGTLHGGSSGYGVIIALFSVGAVGGALVAGSIKTPRRPGLVLSATAVGAMAALGVLPYLGAVWGAGLAFAVTGSLLSFGNLVAITAFQRWAPPHLLGRIMGLILVASVGTFPFSVAVGGVLVHAIGAAGVFPIAAAGGIMAILVGLTSRSWREFSVD